MRGGRRGQREGLLRRMVVDGGGVGLEHARLVAVLALALTALPAAVQDVDEVGDADENP